MAHFVLILWIIMVVIVWLDLQLPMQSVPITTNVVSSNPVHGEVYLIQLYVIQFISDLRQVGSFLRVLRVSSTKKTEILFFKSFLDNI